MNVDYSGRIELPVLTDGESGCVGEGLRQNTKPELGGTLDVCHLPLDLALLAGREDLRGINDGSRITVCLRKQLWPINTLRPLGSRWLDKLQHAASRCQQAQRS